MDDHSQHRSCMAVSASNQMPQTVQCCFPLCWARRTAREGIRKASGDATMGSVAEASFLGADAAVPAADRAPVEVDCLWRALHRP